VTQEIRLLLHDFMVLFAMVNVVGNLPIFADLTAGMDRRARGRAFRTAVVVAAGIVISFAFLGNWMLAEVFQVDTGALRIAGGVLVFVVAARGVILGGARAAVQAPGLGNVAVFPMGFPFLVGPGTILTTILLMQTQGSVITAGVATLVYLAILPLLYLAPLVERAVGRVGVLVVSRILYVFIAAKAVSFVVTGIGMTWQVLRTSP
jgi:multiple antibiotic resistance protein